MPHKCTLNHFESIPASSAFSFWYVFLQNCDLMESVFQEDIHYDVDRKRDIGKGTNGTIYKVNMKDHKHCVVVREVRYLMLSCIETLV